MFFLTKSIAICFQSIEGRAMESDFKLIAETLLARIVRHLKNSNQSSDFVENLGFIFWPNKDVFNLLMRFTKQVETEYER